MQITSSDDVRRVLEGRKDNQPLKVVFVESGVRRKGIFELRCLRGKLNEMFTADRTTALRIIAVSEFGNWSQDSDRTIVITPITGQFDPDWFAVRLWKGLESLEVVE